MKKVAVIFVTYNSEKFMDKAMECLRRQSHRPSQIIIVDTGSADTHYLDRFVQEDGVDLIIAEKESGFCKGNNIGYRHVDPSTDYVFLVNPDAFLSDTYIEQAVELMDRHPDCGALTGRVLGYDIALGAPTGRYDTTGVFSTWYGRWYDRGQGEKVEDGLYLDKEEIPAICGALFFSRKRALDQVLVKGVELFDSKFYMYKEDIDLSLRLRKAGWKLLFDGSMEAHHCRGWNPDRRKMPRKMRLCSARNDLRIHSKNRSFVGTLYGFAKYSAVLILDL